MSNLWYGWSGTRAWPKIPRWGMWCASLILPAATWDSSTWYVTVVVVVVWFPFSHVCISLPCSFFTLKLYNFCLHLENDFLWALRLVSKAFSKRGYSWRVERYRPRVWNFFFHHPHVIRFGFLQRGHGVPPELCQAVLDVGHEFFAQPESQKLRIGMSSASGFRLFT